MGGVANRSNPPYVESSLDSTFDTVAPRVVDVISPSAQRKMTRMGWTTVSIRQQFDQRVVILLNGVTSELFSGETFWLASGAMTWLMPSHLAALPLPLVPYALVSSLYFFRQVNR